MITIFTICTGKYSMFFENFYNSCEEFFLKDYNKKYYVFTDGDIIERDNIVKIHQEKLGWPYDTMMRFQMFNMVKDDVMSSDYAFFFNVNILFLKEISQEVLPNQENGYLVGVRHQGYYYETINSFPYERDINSSLFIPYGSGRFYYQGCFIGGRTKEFMEMSMILDTLIKKDLSNNIIPIWHDESALNWYYASREPLGLHYNYAIPEAVKKEDSLAIQLDKNKFGGHQQLRD